LNQGQDTGAIGKAHDDHDADKEIYSTTLIPELSIFIK
jgi:hypothetical protein